MNESSINQESNETTSSKKLFWLSRPLLGALIGILSFLLIEVIFWSTNLFTGFIILISPGILTAWTIIPSSMQWSTSIGLRILSYSIIFGISAIPPAVLGSFIISKEKEPRSAGIVLSIIYIIFLLTIGNLVSTRFD